MPKKAVSTASAKAQKPKRKPPTPFHPAAFTALGHYLREYDAVTLKEEQLLSKQALRIDILIIKKSPAIRIDRCWARIFRGHNIVEYKSPVGAAPSIHVFNKVLGYAGLYASQEKVSQADMSASIICFKKPKKLLETLEKDLDCRGLQKEPGIYYIMYNGTAPEKSLAIQVVVSSELPDSEFLLKDLNRNIGHAGAKRFAELYEKDEEHMGHLSLWLKTVLCENLEFLLKEEYVKDYDEMIKQMAIKTGVSDAFRQEGEQKGRLEERRSILEFLRNGHTLEEAEKKFVLT
ncbi:MAG: hypothetical protein FWC23_08625 [Chitinispirillia bacterium]|nr:hypothetical protein [Chitinispirillia bacterium]